MTDRVKQDDDAKWASAAQDAWTWMGRAGTAGIGGGGEDGWLDG